MDSPCNLVRQSCEWVINRPATSVKISNREIEHLVQSSSDLFQLSSADFDRELHFVPDDPKLIAQYLLVVDTLNFCFWQDADLEYGDLAGGIKKSVLKDPLAISAARLASIDEEGVRALLQWPRPVPLASERARLLREVGRGLSALYGGRACELVHQAGGSAVQLVSLVTAAFPGFRDHAVLQGRQVFYYKRAQIFAGDLWGAFQGQGLGAFHDIDQLTMFADYRVPAVLRELGVLEYSADLGRRVDQLQELPSGSEEEIEIRSATVVAVERIRATISAKTGRPAPPSVCIDWGLWELGERERKRHRPHHRTLTIYY